ncbi:hypothetical protein GCM10023192_34440 [Amycolatopsis samaneae]
MDQVVDTPRVLTYEQRSTQQFLGQTGIGDHAVDAREIDICQCMFDRTDTSREVLRSEEPDQRREGLADRGEVGGAG